MNGQAMVTNTLQPKGITVLPGAAAFPIGRKMAGLCYGPGQMLDLECRNLFNTHGLQRVL